MCTPAHGHSSTDARLCCLGARLEVPRGLVSPVVSYRHSLAARFNPVGVSPLHPPPTPLCSLSIRSSAFAPLDLILFLKCSWGKFTWTPAGMSGGPWKPATWPTAFTEALWRAAIAAPMCHQQDRTRNPHTHVAPIITCFSWNESLSHFFPCKEICALGLESG